jgi:hypothetical protein
MHGEILLRGVEQVVKFKLPIIVPNLDSAFDVKHVSMLIRQVLPVRWRIRPAV